MCLAASKSEESTAARDDKSAGDLTQGSSTEGELSPKKQPPLSQRGQGQTESQGQNGDTPTGRKMKRNTHSSNLKRQLCDIEKCNLWHL